MEQYTNQNYGTVYNGCISTTTPSPRFSIVI